MEELVDDEGIDLESLQAQIDLSLAQTQNLVASWLKPSEGASSTSTVHRIRQEMEIQELMKRPARLGVGAPIPASTGTLGLETMKLKGKLTGKKRAREAEDGGSKAAAEPSDDEEESRAGAIKKKARVDPFAPKAKKKQSGDSTLQVQGKVSKPTVSKLSPPSTPPRTKSPSVDAEAESVDIKSPVQATDEVSTGSPDKKKKKKKRKHKVGNKAEEGGDGNVETASVQEHGTAKSPTRDRVTKPSLTADRPQTPPAVGSTELEVPETPATSSHTPHTPQANSTITPKSNVEVNGLPLLNLEGPPPALGASPAKKKRKRNKKKKKRHMEGGEAQVSADRDAEAQGEEEDDE